MDRNLSPLDSFVWIEISHHPFSSSPPQPPVIVTTNIIGLHLFLVAKVEGGVECFLAFDILEVINLGENIMQESILDIWCNSIN
jgi:hypothetical protein